MSLFRRAVDGVATGVIDPLPSYAQPGVFAALCLLFIWFLVRQRKPIIDAIVRTAASTGAGLTALALLPEYVHTRSRRRLGAQPSAVAITLSPLAISLLDTLTDVSDSRPHRKVEHRPRPPWRWSLALCVAPIVLYLIARQPQGADLTPLSDAIFTRWSAFRLWAAQGAG